MFFFLWCFFIIIWIAIIWIIIIALISLLCQPRLCIFDRNIKDIDKIQLGEKDNKKRITLVVKGDSGSGRTIINANKINLNVKRT
ncbi:hypothetical protein KQI86_15850 [Clostridium sp. MSJ-11]|uniref:Uncharacterized protein n=1 Tax=Clostridium mobile TaxID=2841512 RepID=A0ABS6EKQ3_9CLOT|nr:hypothetical protein [Clostridium mobile]MBU5485794.1 hypothetical protein [Clostridium mobile]